MAEIEHSGYVNWSYPPRGKERVDECCNCGMPVYDNGEGTWFGPGDKRMCPTCAESRIKVENPLAWNPEKGCWESKGGTDAAD